MTHKINITMQININNLEIDWEFQKASKYLPVRLSTTYFDDIGECICIVANRADGMTTEIIEKSRFRSISYN